MKTHARLRAIFCGRFTGRLVWSDRSGEFGCAPGASSKGFCPGDEFLERGQRVFDFAATNAVDRQLGAEVKQFHPDGWFAVGAVPRKSKHSDLVTSGSGDRDHSCSLRNYQEFDVGLRDVQSAKRFVECPAHRYTMDAVEIGYALGTELQRPHVNSEKWSQHKFCWLTNRRRLTI